MAASSRAARKGGRTVVFSKLLFSCFFFCIGFGWGLDVSFCICSALLHAKDLRQFKCWMDDYEINEDRNSFGTRVERDAEGDHTGLNNQGVLPAGIAEAGGTNGNLKGKGKGGKGGKGGNGGNGGNNGNGREPKEKKPEQLARAVSRKKQNQCILICFCIFNSHSNVFVI